MGDLKRSPLSKRLSEGALWVDVEIYQISGSDRWNMELLHEDGAFTVWLRDFESDEEAMAEVQQQLSYIGHASLISGNPSPPPRVLQ